MIRTASGYLRMQKSRPCQHRGSHSRRSIALRRSATTSSTAQPPGQARSIRSTQFLGQSSAFPRSRHDPRSSVLAVPNPERKRQCRPRCTVSMRLAATETRSPRTSMPNCLPSAWRCSRAVVHQDAGDRLLRRRPCSPPASDTGHRQTIADQAPRLQRPSRRLSRPRRYPPFRWSTRLSEDRASRGIDMSCTSQNLLSRKSEVRRRQWLPGAKRTGAPLKFGLEGLAAIQPQSTKRRPGRQGKKRTTNRPSSRSKPRSPAGG